MTPILVSWTSLTQKSLHMTPFLDHKYFFLSLINPYGTVQKTLYFYFNM